MRENPLKSVALVLAAALLITGCSHSSSSTYDPEDVGRTIETAHGSVMSSRVVRISGEATSAGPLAGGALGAAGGALTFNSGWAGIIGAVIGAGAGYVAEKQIRNREGIEYLVEMDDGRTVTIVQNRDEQHPLADGTPVLVQYSGKYTRVIEDPRGGARGSERGGAGWIDPDSVGATPAFPSEDSGPSSPETWQEINPTQAQQDQQ
jgi:outer membrane lipoprotein SlyB